MLPSARLVSSTKEVVSGAAQARVSEAARGAGRQSAPGSNIRLPLGLRRTPARRNSAS
jgi:hypothetical protein